MFLSAKAKCGCKPVSGSEKVGYHHFRPICNVEAGKRPMFEDNGPIAGLFSTFIVNLGGLGVYLSDCPRGVDNLHGRRHSRSAG